MYKTTNEITSECHVDRRGDRESVHAIRKRIEKRRRALPIDRGLAVGIMGRFWILLSVLTIVGLTAAQWDYEAQAVSAPAPPIKFVCIEGYLYGYVSGDRAPVPLFRDGRPRACPDLGEYDLDAPSALARRS